MFLFFSLHAEQDDCKGLARYQKRHSINHEALDQGLKIFGSVVSQSTKHKVKVKRERYKSQSLCKNLKIECTHK